MRVQAIDKEMYHWLRAIVCTIDSANNKVEVTWPGYGKEYNCWVDADSIRVPIEPRVMPRNWLSESKFPIRSHPKYLQRGDHIVDREGKEFTVHINDPFRFEVCHITRLFLLLSD